MVLARSPANVRRGRTRKSEPNTNVRRTPLAENGGGMGRLIALMAGFLIVGAPMAAYIWHVLSNVLAGRIETMPILIAAALLVVFLFVLRLAVRYLLPADESAV